jgi:hypothetical protein
VVYLKRECTAIAGSFVADIRFQRAHVAPVMRGRAALLLDCFLHAGQADLARKRLVRLDPKSSKTLHSFRGPRDGASSAASPALTRHPDHESGGRRPSFPL